MKKKVLVIGTAIVCLIFCLLLPIYLLNTQDPTVSEVTSSAESNETEQSKKPSEYDALEALKFCEQSLREAESFSAVLEGSCDTQVLFLNYRQQIQSERYVTQKTVFSQTVRESTLARVSVQQFLENGKILIRNGNVYSLDDISWSDTPVSLTSEAYSDAYGSAPRGLSNYLLNEDTIHAARFVSQTEDTYTFTYQLKPETAVSDYAKQLQTLGALDEQPIFQSAELTVIMDENFRPLSVQCEEEYTISIAFFGATTCKAEYTETFYEFDAVDTIPEQDYFRSYLSLEAEATIPEVSSGYNLLFSFFDNSNIYNLTVTTGEQSIPMHLSFDALTASIYLQGNDFSLLYADDRYYIAYGTTHVFTDAEKFNRQVLPISELSSVFSEKSNNSLLADLFSDLEFETKDGMLLIDSGTEQQGFSAVIDLSTYALISSEINLPLMGGPFRIQLEKTPLKASLPSVEDYKDITESVSALSFVRELGGGGHFCYRLETDGAFSISADITLSIEEQISLSMIFTSEEFPVSLFYEGNTLTAVWSDIAASGTLSDYLSLLKIFTSETESSSVNARNSKYPTLVAEPEKLTFLLADEEGTEITLTPSYILIKSNSANIHLEMLGKGTEPAEKAPETDSLVAVSDLNAFFADSIYPDMLSAGTIHGDLAICYGEETLLCRANISTSPTASFGITTAWNGMDIGLIYSDKTFYLSGEMLNGFVQADRLETVLNRILSLMGEAVVSPADASKDMFAIISIACDQNTLKVFLGETELWLTKDAVQVVSASFEAVGSNFSCSRETSLISHPAKENCVDLYTLSERLVSLTTQSIFSFTGKYVNDDLSATICRMDLHLNANGKLQGAAINLLLAGQEQHSYQLLYDGDAIYFDADGIKLFAIAEYLLAPFQSNATAKVTASNESSLQLDLADIRSITFRDDVLTIEVSDAVISIIWEDECLSQLYYTSKAQKLVLKHSVFAPIKAPSPEGYTDISSIGELLADTLATLDTGSFRFDGQLDLSVLSLSLQNISAQGAFSFRDELLKGYLSMEVPYISGITSEGIPTLQGLKMLTSCSIQSEIFIEGDTLFFSRTITAQYGILQQKTVTYAEKRTQTLEDFLNSPEQALIFLTNLEADLMQDTSRTGTQDTAAKNPLKRFSNDGDTYTLELNPEVVFPASDSISLFAETDGTYLVGFSAEISVSVLSLTLSGDITGYGISDVPELSVSDRTDYLPLHN